MCGVCKFYFVWKLLYVCLKCCDSDVMRIIGECINGMCNVIYVCKVFCWRFGNDLGFLMINVIEKCEILMLIVIVIVKVKENGIVVY